MVSILVHKLQLGQSVVCTDGDGVSLKLLHENAENTGVSCTDADAPADGMQIEKLFWGKDVGAFICKYPRIDLILAADVVYEEGQIEPLLSTTVAILRNAVSTQAPPSAADGKKTAEAATEHPSQPRFILAYARRNVPIDRVYDCAVRLGMHHCVLEGGEEPIVEFTLARGT
jgi:hypothetical protein